MTKAKTKETEASIAEFINSYVDQDQKKEDSYRLIELMQEWSGHQARMWGASIIGFGRYHYKYESGHEGDAALIGFSPRKSAISLYVYSNAEGQKELLAELGKYKMGKACIYIKKLSDVNTDVLEKMCKSSIEHLQTIYE